jgi:hypothetical protein
MTPVRDSRDLRSACSLEIVCLEGFAHQVQSLAGSAQSVYHKGTAIFAPPPSAQRESVSARRDMTPVSSLPSPPCHGRADRILSEYGRTDRLLQR